MTKQQLYKLTVKAISKIQTDIGNTEYTTALMSTEYLHGIIKAYCEGKQK